MLDWTFHWHNCPWGIHVPVSHPWNHWFTKPKRWRTFVILISTDQESGHSQSSFCHGTQAGSKTGSQGFGIVTKFSWGYRGEVSLPGKSLSSLQMAVPCLRGSYAELWQNKTDSLSWSELSFRVKEQVTLNPDQKPSSFKKLKVQNDIWHSSPHWGAEMIKPHLLRRHMEVVHR